MIHNGDCLEVLKQLEDNSIDSLVTDPPAGIAFMNKSWDSDKGGRDAWIKWLSEVMKECLRVMKPGAHGLVWGLPRTSHWTAMALEYAGFEIRDCITHLFGSGFPKSLDISKAIDKQAGLTRERIKGTTGSNQTESRGKYNLGEAISSEAISSEAIKWNGYGTSLKPAAEFWWLVRKPISEKTVAANVLKWGTGGLNIDGCRVESTQPIQCQVSSTGSGYGKYDSSEYPNKRLYSNQSRFPANLVLSHSEYCTDEICDIECAIKQLDNQSSNYGRSNGNKTNNKSGHQDIYVGGILKKKVSGPCYSDKGNVSRFFYCAKVSTKERNEGCEKNNHPTVKAKKLMAYLCRLITPPNGTILDPFMGSGSTGIAAKLEGFNFIGIEKEKEYFEIAGKRISHG